MLIMSFLRMDLSRLRGGKHLGAVLAALVWVMGICPLVLGLATLFLFPGLNPDIMLALVLQTSAPPIMSGAAFAILLGFEPGFCLLIMMACMLVTPFSAPVIVHALSGAALELDPWSLALRIGGIILATAATGLLLRRAISPARITRWRHSMDGVNVILLMVMAFGFMDGITAKFIAEPVRMLGISALAFGVSAGAMLASMLVFRLITGEAEALMVGFSASMRNMMLLVVAAGSIPGDTWLYVGLSQFPIYFLPYLVRPLARRIHRRAAA
ncbi:hypothetical protein GCM10007301_19440 [Azorhizobium oxalatiphilum]|uniref:Na+-dependent transporter n=2 Tax=Azorhizobium oxalatiphilum TaxID=980631 RepID=A0A917F9I0_9HYPH|nr:hypothetical protein GCM10007301_19440 [Azorhizobium oxalatiphilum]